MFLTQLHLPATAHTIPFLSNNSLAHKFVMSGFWPKTEPNERVLFRIEKEEQKRQIRMLVQSRAAMPKFTLPKGSMMAQKEVNLRLENGWRLGFTLLASVAARRGAAKPGEQQLRVALTKTEDQLDWLKAKGEAGGFVIESAHVVAANGPRKFENKNAASENTVTVNPVFFRGVLTVKDAVALRETIESGIGVNKGFGYGMMTLMPV